MNDIGNRAVKREIGVDNNDSQIVRRLLCIFRWTFIS